MKETDQLKRLNELFGSYRAEWLRGKIYAFFTEPSYFTALKDNRPCVLQGGRGTGKTTVLKGLSYQGQYALHDTNINRFDDSEFIGLYYRINTNHVRAFVGGGIAIEKWQKIFGHYFNLIICREILTFIEWHRRKSSNDKVLTPHVCKLISKSLLIREECNNFRQLLELIETNMYEFQAKINNIAECNSIELSMPGDPIKIITEHAIGLDQFNNKMFYILIDEYENLEDNQQQLINTLIKHNTEFYTFKIGVRELGWRIKHTLNTDELLHDPADYVLVNIEQKLTEESDFSDFAKRVCQPRIQQLIKEKSDEFTIEESLVNLAYEDEAIKLKVKDTEFYKAYLKLPKSSRLIIEDLPDLYIYFIFYWASVHSVNCIDMIEDYLKNKRTWDIRYNSYKYEMLFKIRKGRGMVGIQKYYSGWNTYIKLANGNIRYLMELVYRAYEKHISGGSDLQSPVSFEDQTIAAQDIGLKNLMELEGLWKNGAQLTKLLLGFGRIFNVLACEQVKSRPELVQFSISGSTSNECDEILNAAVMNLALIRMPGNKLSDQNTTRDYIYAIHPIFAPYFVFSYRRKRNMSITDSELLGVINEPKKYIKAILAKSNIIESEINELPSQLSLFEDYYND